MVTLPAGEFIMGENDDDKFANDTERPAHRVRIGSGVALSRSPVTVGEFRHFRPGHLPGDTEKLPVVRVSWTDARAYCDWLTKQTGRLYRLPSEAEWEFACRAGRRTSYAWGDEIKPSQANFLYDENGARVGVGRRTAAGQYPPNAFGLCDLHGNVCEWIADAWHPNYFGAPDDGRAWLDCAENRRVIRGGAWDYMPRLLRSAWRDWRPADQCTDNVGFRIATSDSTAPMEE
jgi:formylglycine-generating enzyme required for sulfatase activity